VLSDRTHLEALSHCPPCAWLRVSLSLPSLQSHIQRRPLSSRLRPSRLNRICMYVYRLYQTTHVCGGCACGCGHTRGVGDEIDRDLRRRGRGCRAIRYPTAGVELFLEPLYINKTFSLRSINLHSGPTATHPPNTKKKKKKKKKKKNRYSCEHTAMLGPIDRLRKTIFGFACESTTRPQQRRIQLE